MEVAYVIAKRTNQQTKLKNKHKPKLIGESEDNKKVIGNLFFIIESRGVLLEEAINIFYGNGFLINWLNFYDDGIKKGWNGKTIINKISYAFDESDFCHMKEETIKRLIYCLEHLKK